MKVAIIETDKGNIELELFPNEAPGTVANFEKLANEGFYDGLTFHRVIPTDTEPEHYQWHTQVKTLVEANSSLPTPHNHI